MGSEASSVCLHVLLLLLLSSFALSVHWPVKSLPGYSGDLPFNFETGYISVDDIEFFYYFVESEGNPAADPVLLYLNGGPGCSGLNGFFYQIGPLKFNISDYTGGLPTLMYEPETWTKTASIIFLDAPVGAGFSYANTTAAWTTTDTGAASQYNDFLRSWIDEHPNFSTNPVYIGSDSYAGMNLPILAQDIINSNEAGVEPIIYLKGMVLSCPHTNTDIETNSKVVFAHRMALISDAMYLSAKTSCNGDYVDTTTAACTESLSAITQCIAEISVTSTLDPDCTFLSPKEDEEKASRRSLRESPIKSPLSLPSSITKKQDFYCHNFPYLLSDVWGNYEGVQEALHVRPGTVKMFFRCNVSLSYTVDTDDAVTYHKNLTDTGLQLLVFSGDHDMVIPHNSIEYWITTLDLTLDTDWRPWFVDGQVAGYTRRYTNDGYRLTYATIKGAGHSPHEYKRKEVFDMFHRWIHYYPL
ncbi:PREDICTED: serine carboxypeptidase-like 18 [Fragaria vesca subsp. vesca]|uniref:serine carboxypeptidase-like 18 n=1 Tax=Fragaria vesca subsp. vesca TaxID=101020 RepID=UPI0002C3268E|nr:PREDICTED: serine carboxypeptidase-like 18 [Fragaria vesca subsp. vesca]